MAGVYDNVSWVNHLLCSPDDKRFGFLYRWRSIGTNTFMNWQTVFYTCGADGEDLYCLNNEGMSSHYSWADNNHIICFVNRHSHGWQHYLLTDQKPEDEALSVGKFWGPKWRYELDEPQHEHVHHQRWRPEKGAG